MDWLEQQGGYYALLNEEKRLVLSINLFSGTGPSCQIQILIQMTLSMYYILFLTRFPKTQSATTKPQSNT